MVTVLDTLSTDIINRTFIEIGCSVRLSFDWRRKLGNDHFKKCISSVDPFLENVLEKVFSFKLFFLSLEFYFKMAKHFKDSFSVAVHDVSAQSDYRLHDELDEASSELSSIISYIFSLPFLSFLIEVVVSPKLLHHLVKIDFEFLRVDSGKSG